MFHQALVNPKALCWAQFYYFCECITTTTKKLLKSAPLVVSLFEGLHVDPGTLVIPQTSLIVKENFLNFQELRTKCSNLPSKPALWTNES